MTVHKELDKDVTKYFVSGGFAFVHPDSTADICAVEAVKVTDLDADAVRAGLQVGLGSGALSGGPRLGALSLGALGRDACARANGLRRGARGRTACPGCRRWVRRRGSGLHEWGLQHSGL